jgi:hypothetical protein
MQALSYEHLLYKIYDYSRHSADVYQRIEEPDAGRTEYIYRRTGK